LTGSLIRTLVAATVPVESAVPCAVTHFPTFTDFEVVVASVVMSVFESTVTVTVLVEFEPTCRAAITSADPETEPTVPLATAPGADGPGPLGGPAPPGAPDGAPVGGCPSTGPPATPHVPSAWAAITSVVAVNDVADADVLDGAMAVTQSPARTAARVVSTMWVNLVARLHVTATWPVCGFCTCIVVPEIAATVPEAAGPPCRAGPADAEGEDVDVAEFAAGRSPEDAPLQAVSATTVEARTTTRGSAIMCDSFSLSLLIRCATRR
jgi:hypothetical protein